MLLLNAGGCARSHRPGRLCPRPLCSVLLLPLALRAALSTWKRQSALEANGEEKHFRTRLGHLMPGAG